MRRTILALAERGEPWTRLHLDRALSKESFDVLWTDTEPEISKICARLPVDLLLLTFDRPLRSAWDEIEHVVASTSEVPVVLLTEHRIVLGRSAAARIRAVLQKPPNIPVVVHTIRTLIDRWPRDYCRDLESPSQSHCKAHARALNEQHTLTVN
jgi:DNA-binding response OmpR family regulator